MKTLFKFFVVFLTFILMSPLSLKAMESSPSPVPTAVVVTKIDGVNPLASKKKKKPVAKVKECSTMVEFYAPLEEQQLIINIHCGELFSQTSRKDGAKIVPIAKNGTIAASFDNSKDLEFVEKVVEMTKANEALFLVIDGKAKPYFRHTIALKKASWKQDEVDALRQFIAQKFAPKMITFVSRTMDWRHKPFALPQFAVAANPPIK